MKLKSPAPHWLGRPEKDAYKLRIQIYDSDLLTKDEYIGEFEIDLKLLIDFVKYTRNEAILTKDFYEKNVKDDYGKVEGYECLKLIGE